MRVCKSATVCKLLLMSNACALICADDVICLMLTGAQASLSAHADVQAVDFLPCSTVKQSDSNHACLALARGCNHQLHMKALPQQRHCRASAADKAGSLSEHFGCACRCRLSSSTAFHVQHRTSCPGTVSRRHGVSLQRHTRQTSRTVLQSSAQTASVSSLESIKAALSEALEGTDRGIYGVPVGT